MHRKPRAGLIHAAALLLAMVLSIGSLPARAAPLDDALAHFAADKFPETDKGIDDLIATGAPTTPAILDALTNGRLFFDPGSHKVYYVDASGTLDDAATGAKADGVMEGGLKKVRLNNGIRSKIGAAVGALDLLSSDRTKRLAAAETAFRAHDVKAQGPVDTALAKESDPAIKSALLQARAAIMAVSGSGNDAEKLAAIATLKARGDADAMGLVNQMAAAPDASPAVRAAAASAASSIQFTLDVWQALQNCWYGVSLGSVLLLAAIGLAITFGAWASSTWRMARW